MSRPTRKNHSVPRGVAAAKHDDVMDMWAARMSARQSILAHEVAANRDRVVEFRERYLPDGLLPPRRVKSWLSEFIDGHEASPPPTGAAVLAGDSTPTDSVRLRVALDSGRSFDAWVGQDSPPHELFRASIDLHAEFDWPLASAARWIITRGVRPEEFGTRIVESEVNRSTFGQDEEGRPWRMTVTLKLPIDLPPSRLKTVFEKIQKEHADEYAFETSPRRPALPKNVELAVFAVELRDHASSWAEIRDAWNKTHPDYQFSQDLKGYRLFAKTARNAYRSIMGPHRSLTGPDGDPN